MSFSSDLTAFYVDAPLVAHTSGAFRAWLDTTDAIAFDGITHGVPLLRYPATKTLTRGDTVTINNQSYTVASPPRRVGDGLECVVELS